MLLIAGRSARGHPELWQSKAHPHGTKCHSKGRNGGPAIFAENEICYKHTLTEKASCFPPQIPEFTACPWVPQCECTLHSTYRGKQAAEPSKGKPRYPDFSCWQNSAEPTTTRGWQKTFLSRHPGTDTAEGVEISQADTPGQVISAGITDTNPLCVCAFLGVLLKHH